MSEFSQYSWTGIIDYIKTQKLVIDKEREEWEHERSKLLSMLQEKESIIKALVSDKIELLKKIAFLEYSSSHDTQETHKTHQRFNSDHLKSQKKSFFKVSSQDEPLRRAPVHKLSQSYGEFNESFNESVHIPEVRLQSEGRVLNKKIWTPQLALKSHLDAVRGVHFISEDVLASVGEDRLIKLWDCKSFSNENEGFEPYITLRGHTGAILTVDSGQGIVFTGDSEGFIRSWSVPKVQDVDADGPYTNYCLNKWKAHSDSIWSVRYNPEENSILSASSDSSVKHWRIPLDYHNGSPLCRSFIYPGLNNTPTVCDWVSSNMKYATVGYNSFIVVYNIETSGFSKIPFVNETHLQTHQVNCICSSQSTNLTVTGHEDKRIRFFDLSSNQCIKDMVGHTDSVTDICVDESGLYMLSTGHDGSLRSWDIRNFHCLHEITLNRKKYDESIFSISLHPSQDLIAIGGSDSIIKLLECQSS